MTATPPQEQLSAHFSERMAGRRLVAAVFATFQLDPGFFELEVLPVFVDVPLSHAPALRRVQLEDALRAVPGGVGVYYDAAGLVMGDGGSAKLDVARVPVRLRGGLLHAKNVFALVEAEEPDEDGHRPRTLLAACTSANLTRTGWWENVEVAHVEALEEGEATRLRNPLRKYLHTLERTSPPESDHRALRTIRDFLTKKTEPRAHRSQAGRLHTHLWTGPESLTDFLVDTGGDRLRGMHMEVISPFFDGGDRSGPLAHLLDLVQPKSCRVYLPTRSDGAALVSPELHEWVRSQPGVEWGSLPSRVTQLGKSSDAGNRYVHAKVYRFFRRRPKEELLLVGSANLTTAAHQRRGNVEAAFLVEVGAPGNVDFWLEADEPGRRRFAEPEAQQDLASEGGTRLSIRFDWRTHTAQAHWDSDRPSPELHLLAQGSPLFILSDLPVGRWVELPGPKAERLHALLATTSLLTVRGESATDGLLLIQEEGMSDKPSLLLSLSAEDILRYWSLLTEAQRAAFLESRLPELGLEGGDLVPRPTPLRSTSSMFDRFAGLFHAFSNLEAAVRRALERGNEREAEYRLFGQKYDSLGTLLRRVAPDRDAALRDPVERYLLALCARQLLDRIERDHPDFWSENAARAARIRELQDEALTVRGELLRGERDGDRFLEWYEGWFLRHASELQAR